MSARAIASPAVLLLFLALPAAPAAAETGWPSLRGPDRDSTARGAGLVGEEGFGLERVWQRPLGSGYTGIVAAGGRLYTMASVGEDDVLAAYEAATGRELWRYRVGDRYPAVGSSFDGPLSTPVVAGDRIHALGPRGRVFALALADGRELWSWSPEEPTEARRPYFGFSTAPLLVGGVLVVQTGGEAEGSITAFDSATGEVRWALGDDVVHYQSPAAFRLGDREILLALSDAWLLGIEPESGEVLFRHEHGLSARAAVPTAIGGRKVLLNGDREIVALEITGDGPFAVEEAWRGRDLTRTYALPIVHEGVIYGFSGRFLTAVDAATGERLWRSRPPGGRGLILVDGHLVTLDLQGDLVLGTVDREGFVEKARAKALEGDSFTAPSYAEGLFFVRDLERMAALRVTEAAVRQSGREIPIEGSFGAFLEGLPTEGRQARVDEYLNGRDLPLVEGEGLVHFVYRGEAEDVAVAGSGLVEGESESALRRIEGTDFWARSIRLDSSAHRRYRFVVDYDERLPDPGNPASAEEGESTYSVLRLPGWREPAHLRPAEEPRGRLEQIEIASELYPEPRPVTVHLPPGYPSEGGEEAARLPLLIVTYGERALESLQMANALDRLIGARVEPLAAVFVPAAGRREYRSEPEKHLRFLKDDLVPALEKRFPLAKKASRRAVFGVLEGGFMALYAALHAPETFGAAASMSFYAGQDQITALGRPAAEGEVSPRLYFDWTEWERTERAATMGGHLGRAGLAFVGGETGGTSEWFSWAERVDRPLEVLFPAAGLRLDAELNERWMSEDTDDLFGTLERESREIWAHRQALAAVVAPAPGSAVADVGAGSGFMAFELARRVGPEGKVIAVDINPTMMRRVAELAREQGFEHLSTHVGRRDSIDLPSASLDMVFMADTYHHFDYPSLSLASIHRALRPGGQVVVVDFERIPGVSEDWILGHVRADKEQVIRELQAAGFELMGEHPMTQLEQNYVLRFRRP